MNAELERLFPMLGRAIPLLSILFSRRIALQ
jgi:hypothetical protein